MRATYEALCDAYKRDFVGSDGSAGSPSSMSLGELSIDDWVAAGPHRFPFADGSSGLLLSLATTDALADAQSESSPDAPRSFFLDSAQVQSTPLFPQRSPDSLLQQLTVPLPPKVVIETMIGRVEYTARHAGRALKRGDIRLSLEKLEEAAITLVSAHELVTRLSPPVSSTSEPGSPQSQPQDEPDLASGTLEADQAVVGQLAMQDGPETRPAPMAVEGASDPSSLRKRKRGASSMSGAADHIQLERKFDDCVAPGTQHDPSAGEDVDPSVAGAVQLAPALLNPTAHVSPNAAGPAHINPAAPVLLPTQQSPSASGPLHDSPSHPSPAVPTAHASKLLAPSSPVSLLRAIEPLHPPACPAAHPHRQDQNAPSSSPTFLTTRSLAAVSPFLARTALDAQPLLREDALDVLPLLDRDALGPLLSAPTSPVSTRSTLALTASPVASGRALPGLSRGLEGADAPADTRRGLGVDSELTQAPEEDSPPALRRRVSLGGRAVAVTRARAGNVVRARIGAQQKAAAPDAEMAARLDGVFFSFLHALCSNLDATDATGELVHQALTPKRMQRLDESPDFRPFRFRIQAFTNYFVEELEKHGLGEDELSINTIRSYLWRQPYIARYNEDGRRAKSRGNHIWTVEARRVQHPAGGAGGIQWSFRKFARHIAGAPERTAFVGRAWRWAPHLWDPRAPAADVDVVWGSPEGGLLDWMEWRDGALYGVPTVECLAKEVTIEAKFMQDGREVVLSKTFLVNVLPVTACDAAANSCRWSLSSDGQNPPRVPNAAHAGERHTMCL